MLKALIILTVLVGCSNSASTLEVNDKFSMARCYTYHDAMNQVGIDSARKNVIPKVRIDFTGLDAKDFLFGYNSSPPKTTLIANRIVMIDARYFIVFGGDVIPAFLFWAFRDSCLVHATLIPKASILELITGMRV